MKITLTFLLKPRPTAAAARKEEKLPPQTFTQ